MSQREKRRAGSQCLSVLRSKAILRLQAETREQRGPAFGPGGLPSLSASQSSNVTGSLASLGPAMPSSIGFASHINFSI